MGRSSKKILWGYNPPSPQLFTGPTFEGYNPTLQLFTGPTFGSYNPTPQNSLLDPHSGLHPPPQLFTGPTFRGYNAISPTTIYWIHLWGLHPHNSLLDPPLVVTHPQLFTGSTFGAIPNIPHGCIR